MAIEEYDVFVIGTGNSGRSVAEACVDAGKRVAIADNREYGGVCANHGCDPKKVLVSFTEILERSENLSGKGITKQPEINWADVQKFKTTFTDPVPFVNERKLKEKDIVLYRQSPKFLDEHTLSVEGKTVKAKKIVIASGQKHKPLYFEGSQHLLNSDDFLELKKLPERMVFIGGGYIGMELAHVAIRCGVKVTVIHPHERPLNNFDSDMVDYLIKASEDVGVKFKFKARANKIEKTEGGFKVFAKQGEKTISVKAEMVFNSAGRIPSINELDLDKGQVDFSGKGVTVNDKLQNPSNKNVYACGDAAASPGLPLTPLGSIEAQVVISQLLSDEKTKKKAVYPPQPSVVFTLPNLASVGMSEEEAKKEYDEVKVIKKDAKKWYSAKHLNDKTYAFKILINTNTDKILGAHLVGANVGETINLFALAMANNVTTKDLKNTIFAYPTWGNDINAMIS